MRYLWDLYHGYLHEWTKTLWKRAALAALSCPLRMWDYASAARVDQFVANSRNVQQAADLEDLPAAGPGGLPAR